MDAELTTLAMTAGNTVIALLTTDSWQKSKGALAKLWRRAYPDRVESIEKDLDFARSELVAIQLIDDSQIRNGLVDEWSSRISLLLTTNPELAEQLRSLLKDELQPALPISSRTWSGAVKMSAVASESGRVYQLGQGEQNISGQ
jgi:hypothetical protein